MSVNCAARQKATTMKFIINKVKNLKGKEPWERAMIAKRRKTLVVCRECHHMIHDQ